MVVRKEQSSRVGRRWAGRAFCWFSSPRPPGLFTRGHIYAGPPFLRLPPALAFFFRRSRRGQKARARQTHWQPQLVLVFLRARAALFARRPAPPECWQAGYLAGHGMFK
ncbi:unnamed protein product, partial [Amoebophrya sp. A120]|eukprot:GSA120T00005316001.1